MTFFGIGSRLWAARGAGRPLSILLLSGVSAAALAADPADAFNFYISQSFQHDDNLYRLADGVKPFGDGQRDDNISVTSFSAMFDRVYSRQRLYASVDLAYAAFDTYSDLDYDTKGVATGWDWSFGSHWTGKLELKQDELARDRSDFRTNSRETSINRRRTLDAEADYWWHPDWAAGVGYEAFASEYSDDASQNLNYEASIPEVSLTYRPQSGNKVSLRARFTDGKYPDRTSSAIRDDGYSQRDLRLVGAWRLTGASRLSGYLGYTSREYENLEVRDFSGMTARLQHDWTITGKVQLRTTARREIGAREDLTDNSVVTKAVSVEPTWAPTAKIALQGLLEWRQRDFRGDPGLVTSVVEQDDETTTCRLSVSYMPLDSLSLSLSHTASSRTSDRAANEYDANVTALSAQYSF
ncbi:XrtB/PEP-CTERM-associated polysaccharide biosynthesis outer membrane protein EpsL [Nitrogeniibacter aestuarii]|uniref:XrtB/PEP-CTERM-associated polysaccharide biosynthesis outer membrane protein EpsL n=1 Tax=Nitrogeniibacter aestuarii TaxID=2815343 RepID=UPI001E61C9D6|nr:XrtB/PEP-CTERM-associated polysaccharide biosynthesis outer membrane protein EpsL [Nitrogeniibacter aestuarii]